MEFGGVQQGLGLLSESCIVKVLSELSLPVLGAVGKMGLQVLFHQPWHSMELLWTSGFPSILATPAACLLVALFTDM